MHISSTVATKRAGSPLASAVNFYLRHPLTNPSFVMRRVFPSCGVRVTLQASDEAVQGPSQPWKDAATDCPAPGSTLGRAQWFCKSICSYYSAGIVERCVTMTCFSPPDGEEHMMCPQHSWES